MNAENNSKKTLHLKKTEDNVEDMLHLVLLMRGRKRLGRKGPPQNGVIYYWALLCCARRRLGWNSSLIEEWFERVSVLGESGVEAGRHWHADKDQRDGGYYGCRQQKETRPQT